jgi:hypothetical protein
MKFKIDLAFSLVIFLGAFLLFWVQPLFTKLALPLLGGAPSVWTTSVLFFQAVLLLGYFYVHLSSKFWTGKGQLIVHSVLLLLAFYFLPLEIPKNWVPGVDTPVLDYLLLMTASVGLPFFVVSTTAPLLQRWYFQTNSSGSENPYHLYAASNAGGLLALLSFPILIEPSIGLVHQSVSWMIGLIGLAIFSISLRIYSIARTAKKSHMVKVNFQTEERLFSNQITWRQRLSWVSLTFVPSALLLAVTLHLSTDIAATPFLWVIPLALYLTSFIIAFARRKLISHSLALNLQVWFLIGLAIYFSIDEVAWLLLLHLGGLFVTSVVCHQKLADESPDPRDLTEFYMWISVGGFFGGVFSALIAPAIFNSVLEYPLLIILASFLRPKAILARKSDHTFDVVFPLMLLGFFFVPELFHVLSFDVDGWMFEIFYYGVIAFTLYSFRNRNIRFALGLCVVVGVSQIFSMLSVPTEFAGRSFFGVYTVEQDPYQRVKLLYHGTTVHGAQPTLKGYEKEPLTYYSVIGPLGQYFHYLKNTKPEAKISAVGLGIGTLACHLSPGMELNFIEIDPMVVDIATDNNLFSYLDECGNNIEITIGDGRIKLSEYPDRSLDVIVMDAFSSDAIPIHLMTKEAIQMYSQKLTKDGHLLLHISNRFIDLRPVIGQLIKELNLYGLIQEHTPPKKYMDRGVYESSWVVIGKTRDSLNPLVLSNRWQTYESGGNVKVWTDDYSDVFSYVIWPKLL